MRRNLANILGGTALGYGLAGGFSQPASGSVGMTNPQGRTPASHMDGSVIVAAAARAGIPLEDTAGLNEVVALINRGLDPESAAQDVGARRRARGAGGAGEGSGTTGGGLGIQPDSRAVMSLLATGAQQGFGRAFADYGSALMRPNWRAPAMPGLLDALKSPTPGLLTGLFEGMGS